MMGWGNGFLTGRSGGHGREHPCAKDGTFLFVESIYGTKSQYIVIVLLYPGYIKRVSVD